RPSATRNGQIVYLYSTDACGIGGGTLTANGSLRSSASRRIGERNASTAAATPTSDSLGLNRCVNVKGRSGTTPAPTAHSSLSVAFLNDRRNCAGADAVGDSGASAGLSASASLTSCVGDDPRDGRAAEDHACESTSTTGAISPSIVLPRR